MLLLLFLFFSSVTLPTDPPERDKQEILRLELAIRQLSPGNEALPFLQELKESKINQLEPIIQPLYRLACDSIPTPLLSLHFQQINTAQQNQLSIFQAMGQEALESRNKKRNG